MSDLCEHCPHRVCENDWDECFYDLPEPKPEPKEEEDEDETFTRS